jgi:hypothetical protein
MELTRLSSKNKDLPRNKGHRKKMKSMKMMSVQTTSWKLKITQTYSKSLIRNKLNYPIWAKINLALVALSENWIQKKRE